MLGRRLYTAFVGWWYTLGVCTGLGVALGVLFAGALSSSRIGMLSAAVLGIAAGTVVGVFLWDWLEAAGGGVGGALGALGAGQLVQGTLRRGGTRAGTALLVALGAVVLGALAFVPILGYLEAIAVPLLGARLRHHAPERYAGLRSLARD